MWKLITGKLKNKVCPKCGKSFRCEVKGNCWCEELTIPKEALSMLRKTYMDCLCKQCLQKYAEPSTSTPAVS